MNTDEAAALLTIASGFDRFMAANDITSTAWSIALSDVPLPVAQEAVIAHYASKDGRRSVTVADIREAVAIRNRTSRHMIDADVRSAKARGLIPRDWPDHQELPAGVAAALAEARTRDREVTSDDLGTGMVTR